MTPIARVISPATPPAAARGEAATVTIGAEVVLNRLQVVATHPVDIGDGCVFE